MYKGLTETKKVFLLVTAMFNVSWHHHCMLNCSSCFFSQSCFGLGFYYQWGVLPPRQKKARHTLKMPKQLVHLESEKRYYILFWFGLNPQKLCWQCCFRALPFRTCMSLCHRHTGSTHLAYPWHEIHRYIWGLAEGHRSRDFGTVITISRLLLPLLWESVSTEIMLFGAMLNSASRHQL